MSHYLPRIGMQHRRVMEDGQVTVYASSHFFRPDRIEFSETDADKSASSYFTLEKLDTYRTKLTVDYYLKKGAVRELWFTMAKKEAMEASLNRSLLNLDGLVKEIRVPTEY